MGNIEKSSDQKINFKALEVEKGPFVKPEDLGFEQSMDRIKRGDDLAYVPGEKGNQTDILDLETGEILAIYENLTDSQLLHPQTIPSELTEEAIKRALELKRQARIQVHGEDVTLAEAGDIGSLLRGEETPSEEAERLVLEAKMNQQEFANLSAKSLSALLFSSPKRIAETKQEMADAEQLKRKQAQALDYMVNRALNEPFGDHALELGVISAVAPSGNLRTVTERAFAEVEKKRYEVAHGAEINTVLTSGQKLSDFILHSTDQVLKMAGTLRLVEMATHDDGTGRRGIEKARDQLEEVYYASLEGSPIAILAREALDGEDREERRRYTKKLKLRVQHPIADLDLVDEFVIRTRETNPDKLKSVMETLVNQNDREQLIRFSNATAAIAEIRPDVVEALAVFNEDRKITGQRMANRS